MTARDFFFSHKYSPFLIATFRENFDDLDSTHVYKDTTWHCFLVHIKQRWQVSKRFVHVFTLLKRACSVERKWQHNTYFRLMLVSKHIDFTGAKEWRAGLRLKEPDFGGLKDASSRCLIANNREKNALFFRCNLRIRCREFRCHSVPRVQKGKSRCLP